MTIESGLILIGLRRMFDARPNLASKGTGSGLTNWLDRTGPYNSVPSTSSGNRPHPNSNPDYHNRLTGEPPTGFANKLLSGISMDRLNEFRQQRLAKLRSWTGEFFKFQQFSIPDGILGAQNRVTNNLGYFQANYLVVIMLLFVYCLVTHLFMAVLMAILVAGFIYVSTLPPDYSMHVAGMVLTKRNLSITLIIAGILVFLFTGVSSTFFWLVGISALMIGTHAILHEVVLESDFAQQQA